MSCVFEVEILSIVVITYVPPYVGQGYLRGFLRGAGLCRALRM